MYAVKYFHNETFQMYMDAMYFCNYLIIFYFVTKSESIFMHNLKISEHNHEVPQSDLKKEYHLNLQLCWYNGQTSSLLQLKVLQI